RLWYPYTIRFARSPVEARVWFGLTNIALGFAVLARINGHMIPVLPPDERVIEVEDLALTPGSVEGDIPCEHDGPRLRLMAGQGHKRAYFAGRGFPATWLSAGANTLEISTTATDGSMIYETAPAVWIKGLSVR